MFSAPSLTGFVRRRRFEALLAPCWGSLRRFAGQLEGDPNRAEDLVQAALVTGLRKLDSLREDAAFRAWMCRIVYRTWQEQQARFHEVLVGPEELESRRAALANPELSLGDRRLAAALERAFQELPLAQREAVWLVDGEGFSFAEAAEVLELSPGTVASRVARGRAALRVDLREAAAERGVIR